MLERESGFNIATTTDIKDICTSAIKALGGQTPSLMRSPEGAKWMEESLLKTLNSSVAGKDPAEAKRNFKTFLEELEREIYKVNIQ